MVQKKSNLKNRVIFEILPNFAPIFRGEGVEDREKKLSISIRKYISRAIQIWNQIFKISSCAGYMRLKNVTFKGHLPIFGPFFSFSGKWEFFQKMVSGAVYTL